MKQTAIAAPLEQQIRIALGLPSLRSKTCPIMRICVVKESTKGARTIIDEQDDGRTFTLNPKATQVVVSGGELQTVQRPEDGPKVGDVLVVFTAYNADCKRPSHWGYYDELVAFKPEPAFGDLGNALVGVDVAKLSLDKVDLQPLSPEELERAARELVMIEDPAPLITVIPGDDDGPESTTPIVAEEDAGEDEGDLTEILKSRRWLKAAVKIPRVGGKKLKVPHSSAMAAEPKSSPLCVRQRMRVQALVG